MHMLNSFNRYTPTGPAIAQCHRTSVKPRLWMALSKKQAFKGRNANPRHCAVGHQMHASGHCTRSLRRNCVLASGNRDRSMRSVTTDAFRIAICGDALFGGNDASMAFGHGQGSLEPLIDCSSPLPAADGSVLWVGPGCTGCPLLHLEARPTSRGWRPRRLWLGWGALHIAII